MSYDMVNPDHYKRSKEVLGVEVIQILDFFFGDDPHLWQVGKYLLRAGHKPGATEDLDKALWYLEHKLGVNENL